MKGASFRSRGSAARRPMSGEALHVMRARWRDLAEHARRTARATIEDPLRRHDEPQLSNQLIRTGSADIPVEGESARHVRGAFVEAVRALLIAAPDRRVLCAELVAAAAMALLELLDMETRKAAAAWQKQFGD